MHMKTQGHGIDKYPAKAHARRVADTLNAPGIIAISASTLTLWPDSDMPMPFRQARYFYYLTGCDEPGCWVVYDIDHDRLTLWLPAIDESRVVWTGRGSTVEEAMEKYDIDEAKYLSDDEFLLGRRLSADEDLYMLQPDIKNLPFTISIAMNRRLKGTRGKLKQAMDACRVIKDEHEIALIRQANDITAEAHTSVMRNIHRFTNEAEVEAAYTAVCIARHAKTQAYAPIAGSGPNAATLHYGANNQDFSNRHMLVLDAGCEVSCYASDVTRTLPLNPTNPGHWPTKECEQIYALVEKVQETCIAALRPGAPFTDIDALARRTTLQGLLALGILVGDPDEIHNHGIVHAFFPHGLGHHVGLEVHDVSPVPAPPASHSSHSPAFHHSLPTSFTTTLTPPLTPPFSSTPLKPNMLLTIEPGLYFNRQLLTRYVLDDPVCRAYVDTEVLDRYWSVGGVRIEDDILITDVGYENVTGTPKGSEMLEVIRRGKGGKRGRGMGDE
ncbi:hypothetical protein B0A50_04705 [Salinomyces thailandicus]|uniref:Xaa-Pro aminopeptidase n=1 Tax=Salinomyces thailandicus TaxID=706561 RepID=A0A4U0TWC6_9PEZI|nr:hypothetical protein B0A50_04705 [Salinomyces thailandica]